jgi:hypothetical protein
VDDGHGGAVNEWDVFCPWENLSTDSFRSTVVAVFVLDYTPTLKVGLPYTALVVRKCGQQLKESA